jgi:hypothetical protein
VAAPVVGSSAFTKSVRGALLEQDSLSEPQRLALGRLQAAKSTATPTVFVEQEVGRWLGTARSPRRTALATARTELGVLQELKESLAEQQAQAEQEEAAERAEVRKRSFFAPFCTLKTRIFCQDRLGANTGKVENKRFCRWRRRTRARRSSSGRRMRSGGALR